MENMRYQYVCYCIVIFGAASYLSSISKACTTLCKVYLPLEKFDDALELAEMAWGAVRNRPVMRMKSELHILPKPAIE